MIFTLKLTAYFVISFSILCLPINKEPLFNTLYHYFGKSVLSTMDNVVASGKRNILPKIVSIIKSEPSMNTTPLPDKYSDPFIFSNNHYTAEEKNLMRKVLDRR